MNKRPAPQGIDLEILILGYILMDSSMLDHVLTGWREEDFTLPIHRKIFAAMKTMYSDNKEITISSVAAKVLIENIQEILTDLIRTARSIGAYCHDKEYEYENEPNIWKFLFTWDKQTNYFPLVENYSHASYMAQKMLKFLENKNGLHGIATGLKEFDFRTGGLCKGSLIVIGSRPSQGKTAFVLNLARTAALNGSGVLYFTQQNSGLYIFERMACAGAKVNIWELRTGKLNEDKKKAVAKEAENLAAANLVIEDAPNLSVGEICSKSREISLERKSINKSLDLVIIDSPPSFNTESILRFKELARALDAALILTIKLPRPNFKTKEYRPQQLDLTDTAVMEYADLVCFLHREGYFNREDETLKDKATLLIAQNREGPAVDIDLKFDAECNLFSNPVPEDLI